MTMDRRPAETPLDLRDSSRASPLSFPTGELIELPETNSRSAAQALRRYVATSAGRYMARCSTTYSSAPILSRMLIFSLASGGAQRSEIWNSRRKSP